MLSLKKLFLPGLLVAAMPLTATVVAAPLSLQQAASLSIDSFIAFENGLIAKPGGVADTVDPDDVENISPPLSDTAQAKDIDALSSRFAILGQSLAGPVGLTLTASILPAPEDIGQPVNIYVAAVLPGGLTFFRTSSGGYEPISKPTGPLPTASSLTATGVINVPIVSDLPRGVPIGTQILVGYGQNSVDPVKDLLSGKYNLVYLF